MPLRQKVFFLAIAFVLLLTILDLVRRKVVDPQEGYARAMDKASLLASFKKNAVDTSWAPPEALAGA